MGLITKLFGTYSERELKSIYPVSYTHLTLPTRCQV